jgi:hypothetical protein
VIISEFNVIPFPEEAATVAHEVDVPSVVKNLPELPV